MQDGKKRGVGRPRADGHGVSIPAKEAILLTAARLFANQGYSGTSTREIADQVGIRQPSLFYHFKKKEDILLAIIKEVSAEWADYLPQFEKQRARGAVKLYELMRYDFHYLMTEPYGIGQLIVLPEMRGGEFRKRIELMRNRIIGAYRKSIKQGIKEGDFIPCDLKTTTLTVFGMGETLWTWYRPTRTKTPSTIAEQIADLAMRALLTRPSALNGIKKAAKVDL